MRHACASWPVSVELVAHLPVLLRPRRRRAQHLEPHERVLHSGLVEKRVGLFARKRQLLLTTKPRLIYFDPAKFVLKGEIPWGPTLRVQVKDRRTFDIHVVRGAWGHERTRQCD